MTDTATAPASAPADVAGEQPSATSRRSIRSLTNADFAPLPVLAALMLICVVFQAQNSRFLSPENISNLVAQIAATGLIATGVVLVLLIGEIDLSVGIVSGLAASVAVVLNIDHGVAGWLSMIIGLAAGAGVGLVTGVFVTRFHVPSFVVTLAGLLGWQGAMLGVLGPNGSVNVSDQSMLKLASTYFADATGLVIGIGIVAAYAVALALHARRRAGAGLRADSPSKLIVQTAVLGVVVIGSVLVLNSARGVPLSLLILVSIVAATDLVTRKTVFGRHVFAVGGNVEAARRAGIRVNRVKIAVFMIGSTMAAAGGMLAAGRLLTVTSGSGGGDLLLNSIAAAVIGGTSLFGGRGSAWAALLGALVIGAISNGMDLLSVESATKFGVTGAVLLAAVTIDSMARQRYRASPDEG
jgi:D-xylose transport system permease protein